MARMTPDAVMDKYGVPPRRYPEIAALVGETSDNLPGVPGVGPKTAAKWITQYDGLDNVIANADQIKGKAGDSFREHLGDVIRNRRLNALVCDLELTATVTDLAAQPWDRQEVHKLFDSLEFRVLRERLFATLESEEEIDDSGFELETTQLEPGALVGWLDAHARAGARVGVQVQGTWRAGSGDVYALAFAAGDGSAAWLDVEHITPEDDATVGTWLADAWMPKVMHDAKGRALGLSRAT
jgi:DNA polymerase-1